MITVCISVNVFKFNLDLLNKLIQNVDVLCPINTVICNYMHNQTMPGRNEKLLGRSE